MGKITHRSAPLPIPLLLFFAAVAGGAAADERQTAIQVYVEDFGDGTAISGVKVRIFEAEEHDTVIVEGVTNSQGLYTATLSGGDYRLEYSKYGYIRDPECRPLPHPACGPWKVPETARIEGDLVKDVSRSSGRYLHSLARRINARILELAREDEGMVRQLYSSEWERLAERKSGEARAELAEEIHRTVAESYRAIVGELLLSSPEGADADWAHQGMSPEEEAMMEAWMKASTPGEQHAWLASRAGTWKGTVKMFGPGLDQLESVVSIEREVILDGRVLKGTHRGYFQGMPFEGIEMVGFDNISGKFWSTWFDNLSTGLFTAEGELDSDGRLIWSSSVSDPMAGATRELRTVVTFDEDTETYETFQEYEGEMLKTMGLVFERIE